MHHHNVHFIFSTNLWPTSLLPGSGTQMKDAKLNGVWTETSFVNLETQICCDSHNQRNRFARKLLFCPVLFHVVCNFWSVDMSWRQWLEGYLTWNLHSAFCSACLMPALELSMITGLKICAPLRIFHQQCQVPVFHWKGAGEKRREIQTCPSVTLCLMWRGFAFLCILFDFLTLLLCFRMRVAVEGLNDGASATLMSALTQGRMIIRFVMFCWHLNVTAPHVMHSRLSPGTFASQEVSWLN